MNLEWNGLEWNHCWCQKKRKQTACLLLEALAMPIKCQVFRLYLPHYLLCHAFFKMIQWIWSLPQRITFAIVTITTITVVTNLTILTILTTNIIVTIFTIVYTVIIPGSKCWFLVLYFVNIIITAFCISREVLNNIWLFLQLRIFFQQWKFRGLSNSLSGFLLWAYIEWQHHRNKQSILATSRKTCTANISCQLWF